MDWNYQIGNFICEQRREKGLTQKQLGDMLGVTNKAVSKWENGSAVHRVQLLPKLAELLGCSQEELFLGYKQHKTADDPSTGTETVQAKYLSVVKRCDCCHHRVPIMKKTMKCNACGATLKLSRKSAVITIIASVILDLVIIFLCKLDSIGLTQEYFANAFPTAESARMHAELQENFPTIRLIATFAAGFIYLVGLHIFALLWYFLINKLLLKRLSFQVSHYPHIEDGKIIL